MDIRDLAKQNGTTYYCGGCEDYAKQLDEARRELKEAVALVRLMRRKCGLGVMRKEVIALLARHADDGPNINEDDPARGDR